MANLLIYFSGEYLNCYDISFIDEKGVQCLYHLNYNKEIKRKQKVPYPLCYADVSTSFQSIWDNWIIFKERHEPSNSLIFECLENSSRQSNQFLNLMQALEVYSHRERNNEAKKVFNKYQQNDPENNIKLALKHRLLEILTFVNDIYCLQISEIEILATLASDTRNYYTHYSASKKDKSFILQDFGKVNRFFMSVLIIVVWKYLDIPSESIIKAQEQLFFGNVIFGIKTVLSKYILS